LKPQPIRNLRYRTMLCSFCPQNEFAWFKNRLDSGRHHGSSHGHNKQDSNNTESATLRRSQWRCLAKLFDASHHLARITHKNFQSGFDKKCEANL